MELAAPQSAALAATDASTMVLIDEFSSMVLPAAAAVSQHTLHLVHLRSMKLASQLRLPGMFA